MEEMIMIEIIQEENWEGVKERRELPKNVKQMGTPDAGERIYIENDAYQKMHPYGKCPEKLVYVLMGRFDKVAENDCTFIEDAIEMPEIEFQGNLPVWTDESWGCLYRKLCPEHDKMVIVGWAVDICGQFPGMTAQLEYIHHNYFGGTHQVLMLLDSLEREEVFYSNKNGYLKRRMGFYICNNGVLLRKEEKRCETNARENVNDRSGAIYDEDARYQADEQEFRRQESYREYLNNRRPDMNGFRTPPQKQGVPVSTLLLLLVVAALGYSTWQNQKKADEMQQALSQMTNFQTEVQKDWGKENANGVSSDETVVRVEEIIGSVTPDTSQSTTEAQEQQTVSSEQESNESMQASTESTQVPSTQIPVATETAEEPPVATTVLSEADIYLQQGYYIVQSGDSLAGICQKIYHTSAMMGQICELNKIENPDAIYAGQYIKLP